MAVDVSNPADGVDGAVVAGIAATVRAKRLAAGLSMRALATKAGMSQPFLSNLENGRAMPSIATLYKIAGALGVSARDFLAVDEPASISVVRAGEGPLNPVGDEATSTRSRLVAGGPGRVLEAHAFDVASGETLGTWFEHDGEDLLMVVEGRLLVEFGDGQQRELGPGDVLWHLSTIAHRWSVVGPSPTRLLLVNAHAASPTAHGG